MYVQTNNHVSQYNTKRGWPPHTTGTEKNIRHVVEEKTNGPQIVISKISDCHTVTAQTEVRVSN